MARKFFSIFIITTLLIGITISIIEHCGGFTDRQVLNQCPVDTLGTFGMSVAQALDSVVVTAVVVFVAGVVLVQLSLPQQYVPVVSIVRLRHARLLYIQIWRQTFGSGHYSSSYR